MAFNANKHLLRQYRFVPDKPRPDRRDFKTYRDYMRAYMKWYRKQRPAWNTELARKWAAENREKVHARGAVVAALARGELSRQPCERCGKKRLVHAHHEDYSKPLDVMWLCPVHHKERHAELNLLAAEMASDALSTRKVSRG